MAICVAVAQQKILLIITWSNYTIVDILQYNASKVMKTNFN